MSLYPRDTFLCIGAGDREWDGIGDRKQGMGEAGDRGKEMEVREHGTKGRGWGNRRDRADGKR